MELIDGGTASPEPEPRIIGLTGGIASGKTTVAQFIENMGFPVYYSDTRAKALVNENPQLKMEIQTLLGQDAYTPQGEYNRPKVSELIFENEDLLRKLNAIIHPAVKKDFEQWTTLQTSPILFKETALLFELGLDKDCYKSLLVTAEDNLRMKRVMDRDGKTYRQVEKIIEKQMPEKDKIKRADYILLNNEGLEELEHQTVEIIKQICKTAKCDYLSVNS